MHAPQIRMLKAVCNSIDEMLDEHTSGEFIEAALRCGREIACRSAEKLEEHDKAVAAKLLEGDSGVRYNPKGKASK